MDRCKSKSQLPHPSFTAPEEKKEGEYLIIVVKWLFRRTGRI